MTSTAVPRSTARLRRIDLRVVIGLALLLAGVLGTVAVVQRAGQRVPVLVVAREVPAGQVVGDQDVRVAEMGLAPGVATLGVGDRGRVVGRVARVRLAAGQVLTPAAMVDGGPELGPGRVAMSVAVAPEHAAAGQVHAGDRVAVVASAWGTEMRSCSSLVLMQETAEQVASVDPGWRVAADEGHSSGWIRRLKLQRPVGAMSVVVRDVHLEGPLQVPAAHDQ
jgi:Flp pilus assembly protein CpaB